MFAIKFAELHQTLFMGNSLGTKVEISKYSGMKMFHDIEKKLLYIQYKGRTAIIESWAHIEPVDPKDYGLDIVGVQIKPGPITSHPTHSIPVNAQVSDPTGVLVARNQVIPTQPIPTNKPQDSIPGQELTKLTGRKKAISRAEIVIEEPIGGK